MADAGTLELYAARAALYLAIAEILDAGPGTIGLATLRVTLGSSEPPAALALAWETVRHVVERMDSEPAARVAPAASDGARLRAWSRDLRTVALCTDDRRAALLRGEASGYAAGAGRCSRSLAGCAAQRLRGTTEELGGETNEIYASLGRVLGWILRDDPHLAEADAQGRRNGEPS